MAQIVGRDATGRSVFQGPRGGLYVVTAGGSKRYVKAHQVRYLFGSLTPAACCVIVFVA